MNGRRLLRSTAHQLHISYKSSEQQQNGHVAAGRTCCHRMDKRRTSSSPKCHQTAWFRRNAVKRRKNGRPTASIRLKTGGTDCLQYRIWASPIKQNTNGVRTDFCYRLFLKKSAPHRAISTEQNQHRNKPKEGSAHYSPPVLPFFASRPFSRILSGSWSARLRVLASGVGHADPPCYYGGSI